VEARIQTIELHQDRPDSALGLVPRELCGPGSLPRIYLPCFCRPSFHVNSSPIKKQPQSRHEHPKPILPWIYLPLPWSAELSRQILPSSPQLNEKNTKYDDFRAASSTFRPPPTWLLQLQTKHDNEEEGCNVAAVFASKRRKLRDPQQTHIMQKSSNSGENSRERGAESDEGKAEGSRLTRTKACADFFLPRPRGTNSRIVITVQTRTSCHRMSSPGWNIIVNVSLNESVLFIAIEKSSRSTCFPPFQR